jgi:hypothetical protein
VRAPACTSIVRKGRLGPTLGPIGSRRNKRKEAPNTCTLRPHVSHHDHSLPCPFPALFLSQVCTAPFTSPLPPRAARAGPLQVLHRPIPLFDRRTWPACLPDRRFLVATGPFFSARPPSRLRLSSTTRLTSTCSATSALTCTRSDPTARLLKDRTTWTAAAPFRRCSPSSSHRAAQTRGSPPARSFPHWCAPSRLLFAGPYCALSPTLSREAVAVRDGTRHHIERAINTIRRTRTFVRYAARDAARDAAAALRCAAVHEQRPHQVGEWL